MNRPFQIALAIGFVGLIIAIGNGIEQHGFHPGTIAFVAIVLGVYSGIFKRASRGDGSPKETTTDTDRRLSEMESRLTDLQDIVISIDDRLARQGVNKTTQSPPTPS
jgi:uncharacterized membrane protein